MRKKFLFAAILILMMVIGIVVKEFQNDTFYTIKIGEDIVKYGVDFIDHHSFHQLSYSYPHVLFDLLVYFAYAIGNFKAIYLLTIVLTFFFGISMFYITFKLSKNYLLSLVLSLTSLVYLNPFFTARAQSISMIIFIFEYYLLYKLLTDKKKSNIIILFILSIILVNTHTATFPFYLIMFGPFLVSSKGRKDIIICFILCLLSGLISFMGIDSYTYLLKTFQNNTTTYIKEHQPIVLFEKIDVLAIYLIIIYMFASKKIKLELCDIILLLGVSFMTLASIRYALYLEMYTFVILAKRVGIYLNNNDKKKMTTFENKLLSIKGLSTTFVIVLIISLGNYLSNQKYEYINEKKYPITAVNYIKENIDYRHKKIFNDVNIGSYLMLYDIPVFVDSRTDLYTKSYNKKRDIYDDFMDVVQYNCYYEDIFNLYDIDYVLMEKDYNFVKILKHDSNYQIIYEDNYFTLFERNKETI